MTSSTLLNLPPPLVSVTMRTRNRASYLRAAVRSVIAQTLTDWELIISDDASSDDTAEVCREFAAADSRIRVYRNDPGLGAPENWRFCLAQSRGHYFAALDDDNAYLPTFLERAVEALRANSAAFVFTDRWMINSAGERDVALSESSSKLYQRSTLPSGLCADTALAAIIQAPEINSSVFVREQLVAAGGFRHLAGDLADFDLFLHLSEHGLRACCIPERLIEYRYHEGCDSYTYRTSLPKAQAQIRILESVQFSGEAERIRLDKLAQAYLNLSRVLLIYGEVDKSREAASVASRIQPGRARTRIVRALLQLPSSLLVMAARHRYRRDLPTGGKPMEMEAAA